MVDARHERARHTVKVFLLAHERQVLGGERRRRCGWDHVRAVATVTNPKAIATMTNSSVIGNPPAGDG